MPDFTLTAAGPTADSLAEKPRMPRAEAWAEIVIAVAMFAAIAALFVLDPSSHEVDPGVFTLCVGMLALSHAARIDLPNAWTSPVQLALVPTVFLLPAWLVPLTLITAIVIARMPEVIRGGTPPSRLLLTPGNAWFTVGPAAVLLAAGSPSPQDVAACAAGRHARRPDRHRLRDLVVLPAAHAQRVAARATPRERARLRDRRRAGARRLPRRARRSTSRPTTCSCSPRSSGSSPCSPASAARASRS